MKDSDKIFCLSECIAKVLLTPKCIDRPALTGGNIIVTFSQELFASNSLSLSRLIVQSKKYSMGKQAKNIKFPYVERDVSWMYFNRRILLEAEREDVPLLERIKFLGIYSNNLDEFFRVRVASLRREAEGKNDENRKKEEKAQKTLKEIYKLSDAGAKQYDLCFNKLMDALEAEHIHVIDENQLKPQQEQQVLSFYLNKLNASTNPLFIQKMQFSAEQMDEALYLAVDLKQLDEDGEVIKRDTALIRVPVEKFGRFVRLPDDNGETYLMFLDDVIRYNLKYIFVGLPYNSFKAYAFKFTKDAEMDVEGGLEDSMLERVTSGIKSRRKGEMLRMAFDRNMPLRIKRQLFKKAELDHNDARMAGGRYHNTKDLLGFPDCGRKDLQFTPQPPLMGSNIDFSDSMIDSVRCRDYGLHFPYHSFDRFLRLLREAAISDSVKEIKITLYRVAKHSNVVEALMAAAANGKKVTAVVELLARFDEESNISWSQEMVDAGVHVIFGPEKLKIHSKLVYITTRNGDIACISTGNMHEGTAKIYTDYMLITHRKSIVNEVAKVFDFIERPFINTYFRELIVSPNDMRKRFTALINREIRNKKRGLEAFIRIKINHITDRYLISRLYAAAQAGVRIELLVRGNCSIVPEVKGISEGIKLHGIIDRYLEHSRIFIFGNGGEPLYFIGSADWMERNLDRRIEVITPVYEEDIKADLDRIVTLGMQDVSQAYYVNYNDGIPLRSVSEKPWFRSQEALYKYYKEAEGDSIV